MALLGELTPIVGTYLLLASFLTLTAHIAARNFLGSVPFTRALAIGPAIAILPFVLQQYVGVLIVAIAVALDLSLFHIVYRIKWRTAGFVTAIHILVSFLGSIVIGGIVYLVSLGPPAPPS
ncbi:hypothetical protein SAMN05421858_2646 [Haladaptatus litoreus]|uniref:Yip1 domain-containing protein n=1 Tax=Haladaptatus litoreus TaxID=553468 RepID=A0A1N7BN55_9EURY|nr:hypothetical protein [Haladaptatus litoreus]SIR52594.1 hypothetical protein SAMN05421858_2646 [Haladaptatus litoreus]